MRCFCPSVHLSVAYIANNSRTQKPSVPKFGRKVSTLDATRTPVSRSNGQSSVATLLVIPAIRLHSSSSHNVTLQSMPLNLPNDIKILGILEKWLC